MSLVDYILASVVVPNLARINCSRCSVKFAYANTIFQILFDSSRKATGVEYLYKGFRHTVSAKREVIVSGGSINSPQLLMLSGVGPKQHLEELDVKKTSKFLQTFSNIGDYLLRSQL